MIARGNSNAEIAAELGISERTVESHADHIRRKLNLATRRQITAHVAATELAGQDALSRGHP